MKSLELRQAAGDRLQADDINSHDDIARLLRELGVEDPEVLFESDPTGVFVGGLIAGTILAERERDAAVVVDAEVVPDAPPSNAVVQDVDPSDGE